MSKNVKKILKKLKIFSLKIHKGAGISKKKPKTFFDKGAKHPLNLGHFNLELISLMTFQFNQLLNLRCFQI